MIILLLLLISSLCFFKLGTKEKKVVVENKIDYRKENIVFIGDSITELYDLDKHYKNLPVMIGYIFIIQLKYFYLLEQMIFLMIEVMNI